MSFILIIVELMERTIMTIYDIQDKKTGNLIVSIRFYDKKTADKILKHFNKLKRQINIVKRYVDLS